MPVKGKVMTDTERKERLKYVFDESILKYNEVISGIRTHFEVGENQAGVLLGELQRLGWVIKSGKDKSPDAVYKLMT